MKKLISSFFFFVIVNSLSAQEMWGISNSNFSGNMGIFLNPSTIVAAPYKYEINLIAGDIFAENTYAFIPASENFFIKAITGSLGKDVKSLETTDGNSQSAFAHLLVIGPSYINNKRGTKAWGIHTAYRHEISALDMPYELSRFIYKGYKYPERYGLFNQSNSFSAAWMSWAELGGTYGKVQYDQDKNFLKWAATVNLLAGFEGLYLDTKKMDYTFIDSSLVVVHNMDAQFSYAMDDGSGGGLFGFRGAGLSTTLGATYIRDRKRGANDCNNSADALRKYRYRIGVSLMDIGLIYYFSQTQNLTIQTTSDRAWPGIDSAKVISTADLSGQLNSHFNSNTTAAVNTNSFMMFLPAAASVQFDYSFTPHVYANVSWVNRAHFFANQVARGNQIDLSVRYEKRKWEVAANYTLFEYKQSSFGIGFRYWWFVIGTDRFLQLVGLNDVKAFDFFFGIKANLCDLSFRKGGGDCPAFGSKK